MKQLNGKSLMTSAKKDWSRLASEKKIPKEIQQKVKARFDQRIAKTPDIVAGKIK